MQPSEKLRIGVVLASTRVPAWQAALLRSIPEDFEVIVCVANIQPSGPNRAGWMYRAVRLAKSSYPGAAPDALARCGLNDTPNIAECIDVGCTDADVSKALRDALSAQKLDILLDLATLPATANPGALARLGYWYFESGGRKLMPSDGSFAGFAEVLRRDASYVASLRIRLADSLRDLVAFQSVSAVISRSHYQTCNEHLWKLSTFVSRALRSFRRLDSGAFLASLPEAPRPAIRKHQAGLLSFCGYFAWRITQKFKLKGTTGRWVLMWRDSGAGVADFKVLQPPPDRFWADPHVIEVGGVEHIFFEDASRDTGKGHIAVITHEKDGSFSSAMPIIERPYHLSYPFVFEWRGAHYMIPESSENHTVELYRCTQIPDRWEFVHNLMEGVRAYDATLLEHDGRWWMFANVTERDGASSWDELFIYWADSPISRNWRPHAGNPVLSDVSRARPAGPFFRAGDRLVRPSQDSSGRYGRALNFSEVQELTESTYRESRIDTLGPGWDPAILGVHSFSRAGSLTVIDAIRREVQ